MQTVPHGCSQCLSSEQIHQKLTSERVCAPDYPDAPGPSLTKKKETKQNRIFQIKDDLTLMQAVQSLHSWYC